MNFRTKKATGKLGMLFNNPKKLLKNLESLYEKICELIFQHSPKIYSFHRIAHYTSMQKITGFRCVILVHMQSRSCRNEIMDYLERQNALNKNRAHPDRLFK